MVAGASADAFANTVPTATCEVGGRCATLTTVQMFELVEGLAAAGNLKQAESLLESLTHNRDADVRAEARFRLGNLRQNSGNLAGAVDAYAALLDEKPDANPVRLELARVLARLGREDAARSQLRRASSAGLPDDVARVVDQFQLALRSRKHTGASIEIGLAPDTNINHANSSATVTIGSTPFDLSPDAQARSGVGLTVASQGFWRPALDASTNMLLTVSGSGNLFRESRFNDVSLSVALGPELLRGRARYRLSAVLGRRWFGSSLYSSSYGAAVNWLRQINRVSQIQVDLTSLYTDNSPNPGLAGQATGAVLRYERALSPRLFGRVTARIDRQDARDPAFATWSKGGELLISRDFGSLTGYARAGYYRTTGDAEFSFVQQARRDDLVDLEAGVLVRRLSFRGLAPVVRVHRTVNHSPIFFYDFARTRVELGLTREF